MMSRISGANQREANLSEDIGREAEVSLLLHDLLVNSGSNYNQFKALGIAGTAGSGKSTICHVMFNNEQVQKHFLPRIWVCMSKHPWDDPDPEVPVNEDMRTRRRFLVAERMLTCLGVDEKTIERKRENDGISGLVSLLHRHLVGKRYLIVLDDACDADKWYNLGSDYSIQHKPDEGKNFTWFYSTDWSQSLALGLPKGYGGAVIVNGRSDKVVEMMVGKENLHRLPPLTDEDCWNIFKKATGDDPEHDPQVVGLRRFVMQRAVGHPLMAKLMGQCYKEVNDPAQQEANNRNVTPGEGSATQQANSSNGSSVAGTTGPEASPITAPQPVDSNNGSSIAQVTGLESAQITALPLANSTNSSSIAQVTGPESAQVTAPPLATSSNESAQVTAPPLATSSNGSSIAPVTGPEASQETTLQPVNSSNGSSIAQVTGPESAQVTAPPPANTSHRSSIAQVTDQNRPRLPRHNWSIVAMALRWKNLLRQRDRSYGTTGS